MSTAKREVELLLKTLPDDCSLEDIQRQLRRLEKVQRESESAESAETEARPSKVSIRRSLQKRLLSLMRKVSREYFFAGWMIGLEYELWRAVLRYPQSSEGLLRFIEEEDIAELKDLAEELQEWAHWGEGEVREKLIPLADWQRIFADHEMAVRPHFRHDG